MRIRHPEWRADLSSTKYPFTDNSTLLSDGGLELPVDLFVDAALYPIGGDANLHISSVVVAAETVTFYLGDDSSSERASGEMSLLTVPPMITLLDTSGRPAGLLLSDTVRLSLFRSWPIGTHNFSAEQAAFVASVCMPTPEAGVRGIMLDDGEILAGDVYLVGGQGVLLECSAAQVPGTSCAESAQDFTDITVNVVGDPLWRRSECAEGFFETPRFIESITFQRGGRNLVCGPDGIGNIVIMAGSISANSTLLRVRTADHGLVIEAVGERLDSVQ